MRFQENLITAVRNNPVIYDKTLSSYKNLNDREDAWKAVSKELKVKDMSLLKRRWRTLRDAFIKQYRLSKLYESTQPRQKRKKWNYYDQMLFLAPHIESKRPAESFQEETLNYQYSQMENLDLGDDSANVDFHEVEDFSGQSSNQAEVNSARKFGYSHGDNFVKQYFTPDNEKLVAVISKQDADEQFLLSCVPILKRLSTRNNMLARMQIQNLLFNLEFGENGDAAVQRHDDTLHSVIKCETDESSISPESPNVRGANIIAAVPKNMPDSSQLIPTQDTDTNS